LVRIGVIRLGAPATTSIPPLTTWPADLRDKILVARHVLTGGHEFTGEEIAPLDEWGIRNAALAMKGQVDAVAVSGVFSPVNAAHELRARVILREEMGAEIPISISSEIGTLNLLERENATALNAALSGVARVAVRGFETAVRELGLTAEVFFGQNDGTLMALDDALRFPVFSIASGPANSIRGAAYLSGLREAVILDVGGTTSDLGVLAKGFPRESTVASEIGGVLTNFRMPDVLSIGLGGGSVVATPDGRLTIGPETVGSAIRTSALVFGGHQLTATDIAVAAGRASIGDPSLVKHLGPDLIDAALCRMTAMVEEAVDRMKTSAEDVPLVVVGGGSILVPEKLSGVFRIVRPAHFDVANAVGVAIAQVSSSIDQVFSLAQTGRQQAVDDAQRLAADRVIAAGADPATVEMLEVDETSIAYMAGDALRIRVKAAGMLRIPAPSR
jgi:N-methylhydantoinase A/oxoprolinase/acetone carboxylase beta subunit